MPEVLLTTGEESGPFFLDPMYLAGSPDAQVTLDASSTIGAVKLFADGTVSYSAATHFESLKEGEHASDSFVLTVVANGVTTNWTYNVDVVGANDAPVAQYELPTLYARAGSFWSYTVPDDLFTDIDGDSLSYQAYQGFDGALPDWISFDAASRTYSGIIPVDPTVQGAPIDLKIQAFDGINTGGTRFNLVTSTTPYIDNPPSDYVGTEDQYVSIQLPTDMFSSAGGEEISYTVIRANGDPLDSWLTFDPATLTLSGQPPADFNGGFNVEVTASDSFGSSSVRFNISIDPVPDAPTGLDFSTPWIAEFSLPGTPVGVLTARDPDVGDTFTYSLIDDAGGRFALKDNMIITDGYLNSRVDGGTATITVAATDSTGNVTQASFDIAVRDSAQGELFSELVPTSEIHVSVSGSDTLGDGSAENPYATIQHAIDLATPGTAVLVHEGTYAESLSLLKSGAPDAPIWLVSADGVGAAEIKPVGEAEVNAIDGQAIQNWVIEGFAITGTDTIGTYGVNIVSKNNGAKASYQDGFAGKLTANILLKNNIITNWGIDGIHLGYVFNFQVVGNTVSGAHEQGIDVVYGVKMVIANNVVSNIDRMPAWYGLDQRDYTGDSAITIKAGSQDVQILNNVIVDSRGYGIKVGAPAGLVGVPIDFGLDSDGTHYVSYEAKDILVKGNTVLNSLNGALDINAANNVEVVENLLTTTRIGGYDRAVAAITYGAAEAYFPLGIQLSSDTINFVDNLTTAATFHNTPANSHISETGTALYDPEATYDPAQYAWAAGPTANWTGSVNEIFGTGKANVLTGTDGADYIDGKFGDDSMAGGSGDDVYVLDSRSDVVSEAADQGNDTVILTRGATRYEMPDPLTDADGYIENAMVGSAGNFSIVGNSLDNKLVGGNGNDHLVGNAGNDTIWGGAGDDILNGGSDRDFLYGGDGADQLVGGAGDDVLEGGAGRDKLLGGQGNDFLISYDTDDRIWGGAGIDTVYLDRSTLDATQAIILDMSYFGDGTAPTDDGREEVLVDGTRLQNVEIIAISSGAADDYIVGGYFDDQISAGAGSDYVDGFAGDDLIWGAAGDDRLYGGDGNDTIDGGLGADLIHGGTGNDDIISKEADIGLFGDEGIDTLEADRGTSALAYILDGASIEANPAEIYTLADGTLIGGFEVFYFTGGDGNDTLIGGSRDDRFNGGHGNDILYGGAGSDRLNGGAENDEIHGGTGGDTINGGGGADNLWGDAGNDIFTYLPGQIEGDVIHDFEGAGKAGGDILRITGFGPGATLTYSAEDQLWTVASADGLLHESFQILGVTSLISSDYTLL